MATASLRYEVELLTTGFFSGALSAKKLQDLLNHRAAAGWKLSRTIKEERRRMLSTREAVFLIFERDA
jgi:hypothetical protein